MRFAKRVAVSGCAGSGKTLIAVQKARDLDRVGERTLVVCHSLLLAGFIRKLVRNTSIKVVDFGSWVQQINGQNYDYSDKPDWTYYEEPSEQELELALERISSLPKFDAIIVDEGQDFRPNWWDLVEAACKDKGSRLYIFHDDNQALLPSRSSYPPVDSQLTLSKNCRNAGRIFELVKRFYFVDDLEPSKDLLEKGIVKNWMTNLNDDSDALGAAISEALHHLPEGKIVILTTEAPPVGMSNLQGLEVLIRPKWKWQDVVYQYLRVSETDIPLSNESQPTNADILLVNQFTSRKYQGALRNSGLPTGKYTNPISVVRKYGIQWQATDEKLFLKNVRKSTGIRCAAFFACEDWADGIPAPRKLTIEAGETTFPDSLPLYNVASYKGLEADGVILYVPTAKENLEADLYVGISRARYLLHIVADRAMHRRLSVLLA
jgi:hypothetical protein